MALQDKGSRFSLVISSWLSFAIALTFYWITVDPGVSFWDCPEYVTVASKLEVGHPPGNPVWMLAMRMATIPFHPSQHALVINLCSGMFMAFAVLFLARIIFVLVRFFLGKRFFISISDCSANILTSFISVGGSLCFAFCDSVWFSAVEAEVYAMSTFLSALSIWLMIIWWFEKSKGRKIQYLILLAYITGLSLGVHQLNLLLIPVFALIIYYRYHPGRVNVVYPLLLAVVSIIFIGIILGVIIPASLFGAQSFELFSVNRLALPYNSGVFIFCLLISALFIIILILSSRLKFRHINTTIWILAFILLGFSSFGVVLIRAQAYPPMNEGVPDNIFALASYIHRDQYPSSPLLYGATPNSKPIFEESFLNGKPIYSRYMLEKGKKKYRQVLPGASLRHRSRMLSHEDSMLNQRIIDEGSGYILTDFDFKQKLTPELDIWLPRITSRNPGDRQAYEDWAGMTRESMQRVVISEARDSDGNFIPRLYSSGSRPEVFSYRPTYLQNFRFFVAYQAYYMYFRYLFWNFIGRQNDFPSTGEIEHGNFVTGFKFIDRPLLGITEEIPDEIWTENKGKNIYFGIPFIFGIIGILFLTLRNRISRRLLALIKLMFIMTGLAIVVYLNQSPGEPRERDYTFLVSYFAFCLWIAVGFFAVAQLIFKLCPKKLAFILSCLLALCPASILAVENFDDHDRSGRFETAYFASSLLDFEWPAVIFSHGDNSTFPLWYASEVLGWGEKHSPVDISYLSLPSYVVNLKKQGDKGISTTAPSSKLAFDAFILSKIPEGNDSLVLSLPEALSLLYESDKEVPEFPVSRIVLPSSGGDSVIINLRDFTKGSSYLSFRHLILLDIIASQLTSDNPKMIYFPSLIDHSFYRPLDPILSNTLFGKIYAPWLSDSIINSQLNIAVNRELDKLFSLKSQGLIPQRHYIDPVIADRSRRYRGELVIAAKDLLSVGDTLTAGKLIDSIQVYFPYSELSPGDFTVSDSTFYEGREYLRLLNQFHDISGNSIYLDSAIIIDSIISSRHNQWLRYYHSLSPAQRRTLSNRSRRLLSKFQN